MKGKNDPILECAVCGGPSDDFPFGCEKCGVAFTKEDHLRAHNESTRCAQGPVPADEKEADILNVPDMGGLEDFDGILGMEEEEALLLDAGMDGNEAVRTLECMVCGKLFPRGPIDLARHATAVTLKHLVSRKRTSSFSFGCARCGLFMTTAEHLRTHEAQSTCNPNMVWPENAHITAGLRVIHRDDYGKQPPALPNTPSTPATVPAKTRRNHTSSLAVTPSNSSSKTVASKTTPRTMTKDDPSPEQGSKPHGNSLSESRKRLQEAIRQDLQTARQKRAKIIVPEERQAFFGVVSLLIDPKTLPPGTRITEDNYEQFVPDKHRTVVDRLKSCLLYE